MPPHRFEFRAANDNKSESTESPEDLELEAAEQLQKAKAALLVKMKDLIKQGYPQAFLMKCFDNVVSDPFPEAFIDNSLDSHVESAVRRMFNYILASESDMENQVNIEFTMIQDLLTPLKNTEDADILKFSPPPNLDTDK